jgi:hypothetical protein
MANLMTKKQYDKVKDQMYYVRVFDMQTGRQKDYLSGVGLADAVEYMRGWQTYPYYPVMDINPLMQSCYLTDGNITNDLTMTLHLLAFLKNRDKELGAITEEEKVKYLESQNYTFMDAYTLKPNEKYNAYKGESTNV